MIQRTFLIGAHMMSSLGFTLEEHAKKLNENHSGIQKSKTDFGDYYLSKINENRLNEYRDKWGVSPSYSRLEAMTIVSIEEALHDAGRSTFDPNLQLFIASTKGNIDLINGYLPGAEDAVHLASSVKRIHTHFQLTNEVITICNACTSGLMAIIMACRMIQAGHIKEAIVCGVDIISTFTLRGFLALHAMDEKPCQPFDDSRNGITLGEACGTVLISAERDGARVEFLGGGTSNDANHISGPSRTGEGLKRSITQALRLSNNPKIDYINAHGTATKYNDEMEAQAFSGLGLEDVPMHSLKGYWGHTLGAAGVIETIGATLAMQSNTIFGSKGYDVHGVTIPLEVMRHSQDKIISHALKTSSGFGGSNAAMVLKSC